jgi:hypothetical protein
LETFKEGLAALLQQHRDKRIDHMPSPILSIAVKGSYMQPAPPSDGSGHRKLPSQHLNVHETSIYFGGIDIGGADGAIGELVNAIRTALADQTSLVSSSTDTNQASAPEGLRLVADDASANDLPNADAA